MEITFLFQTAEHVRFRKRVELLMEHGIDACVLSFERNSYPGKKVPCKYLTLGNISHGNYIKRIVPFVRAVKKIKHSCQDSSIIYAFGLDMLFLGWLASIGRKQRLVYEVGDIREILTGRGFKSLVARWLERFLLRKSSLLVVTSEAFITEYFNKVQYLQDLNYMVVENKIDPKWFNDEDIIQVKRENKKLVIGYFGVLRCRRSWEILKCLVSKEQNIKVYLRGISRIIDLEETEKIANIEYGGPYVVPDDLPGMYGSVDLIWACYPYQGLEVGNWMWAKTVRFYEACFFQTPLIVQAGTEDSKMVKHFDIGLEIDMHQDLEQVIEKLQSINGDAVQKWQNNLAKLPKNIYVYTDEHEKLKEKLSSII